MTTDWTREMVAGIAAQTDWAIPAFADGDVAPVVAGHDLWDMWQVMRRDGSTVIVGGRSWWFFLAVPRSSDPEDRHDAARMRLTSHGDDGWRDHGWVFASGATPGSREWSGSAVLGEDDETLTLYFTAAGRRGGPRTFEQRLFEVEGRFTVPGEQPQLGDWGSIRESVAADGDWYAVANEAEAGPHGILGFRDPGYFRDPADGAEYLLFTGSAGDDPRTGVIGLAVRDGDGWALHPPLIAAGGVNSELERAHIVAADGRYYLFWSTQTRRFAAGLVAPTGLYAMVADAVAGPWRPVNGTGLVAGNPPKAPVQAYCWWVTGEGDVLSFVDYWRGRPAAVPGDAGTRRATFGGTAAPFFRLTFDGDRVTIG